MYVIDTTSVFLSGLGRSLGSNPPLLANTALIGNALDGLAHQSDVLEASMIHLDHAALAMKAAKGMRRSRQKAKNGRTVCRHLLDLLAENSPVKQVVRSSRSLWLSSETSRRSEDKQFALAF